MLSDQVKRNKRDSAMPNKSLQPSPAPWKGAGRHSSLGLIILHRTFSRLCRCLAKLPSGQPQQHPKPKAPKEALSSIALAAMNMLRLLTSRLGDQTHRLKQEPDAGQPKQDASMAPYHRILESPAIWPGAMHSTTWVQQEQKPTTRGGRSHQPATPVTSHTKAGKPATPRPGPHPAPSQHEHPHMKKRSATCWAACHTASSTELAQSLPDNCTHELASWGWMAAQEEPSCSRNQGCLRACPAVSLLPGSRCSRLAMKSRPVGDRCSQGASCTRTGCVVTASITSSRVASWHWARSRLHGQHGSAGGDFQGTLGRGSVARAFSSGTCCKTDSQGCHQGCRSAACAGLPEYCAARDATDVAAPEGEAPRDQLVQHHAAAPEVCRIGVLALIQLGCHEDGCASAPRQRQVSHHLTAACSMKKQLSTACMPASSEC